MGMKRTGSIYGTSSDNSEKLRKPQKRDSLRNPDDDSSTAMAAGSTCSGGGKMGGPTPGRRFEEQKVSHFNNIVSKNQYRSQLINVKAKSPSAKMASAIANS